MIRDIINQEFVKRQRLSSSASNVNIEETTQPIVTMAQSSSKSRNASTGQHVVSPQSSTSFEDEAEDSQRNESSSKDQASGSIASRHRPSDNEPFVLDKSTGVSLPAGKVRAMSHYRKEGDWTGLIRALMFELNGGKENMKGMTVKGKLENTKDKPRVPPTYYKAVYGV